MTPDNMTIALDDSFPNPRFLCYKNLNVTKCRIIWHFSFVMNPRQKVSSQHWLSQLHIESKQTPWLLRRKRGDIFSHSFVTDMLCCTIWQWVDMTLLPIPKSVILSGRLCICKCCLGKNFGVTNMYFGRAYWWHQAILVRLAHMIIVFGEKKFAVLNQNYNFMPNRPKI